ncbi:phosphoribosyltransferase domain-containing protein [Paracoccus sp. ME4]|uniref:phosphoribosyltransferase domain-containing protein n=1 Tax=Paracoccus sp. ME4 TaxID=3138066 RepID=UPI00398A52F2
MNQLTDDFHRPRKVPGFVSHRMARGRMDLEIHAGVLSEDELFVMAERENPKRGFLFVSKVLGRHIPVTAARHRRILQLLAGMARPHIAPEGGVLVMGYAETAVGLGAGIHDALVDLLPGDASMGYLPTTRHPQGRAVWFEFSEDHSHATGHHVLVPSDPALALIAERARTLVLVDDEVTTGKTFLNLIRAAVAAGRSFDRIVLVTLTDWSNGRVAGTIRDELGPGTDVRIVSLMRGTWSWTPTADAAAATIPVLEGSGPAGSIASDAGAWRGGIAGRTESLLDPIRHMVEPSWSRHRGALVIGTGEYVWQAFRLAEDLQALGIDASFIATTRSPILGGGPIVHKATFRDHYGIGVPMYLHNVYPEDWGQIILLGEGDAMDALDPVLTDYIRNFILISHNGEVTKYLEGEPRA